MFQIEKKQKKTSKCHIERCSYIASFPGSSPAFCRVYSVQQKAGEEPGNDTREEPGNEAREEPGNEAREEPGNDGYSYIHVSLLNSYRT